MKVSANLGLMFHEAGSLINRYEAAKAAGFHFVETPDPYMVDLNGLIEKKKELGLQQVQINAPAGDNKGLACVPQRQSEFRESIQLAISYAKGLGCPRIHVMAGLAPPDTPRIEAEQTFTRNLDYASEQMEKEGITCLIEPINKFTVPGYFLFSYDQALGYIQTIGRSNIKLQLDIFHAQQICGSLTDLIKRLMDQNHIGHIQVAQVPDRHEPHSPGEVDYGYIFHLLREVGYEEFVGAEYTPKHLTNAGLNWIDNYGLVK